MIKGKKEPRIFTPPLRKLTRKTSLGYMFIDFCEALGDPLLPWQEWLSIHALEIVGEFPDNWNFRFRYVIVLVSRQNGKTHWFKHLGLFFNYILRTKLVIGTAQNLDKANDTFEEAVELIEENPELSAEFVKALRGAGRREYVLKDGERWKVVATNRKARGWSSDLILMDELREQTDWEGWSAVSKTMMARPSAILVAVSNAGDSTSVVLRHLRMQAHAMLGDPDKIASKRDALGGEDLDDASIGLFEWSAEPGCDLKDPKAWAQANPSLGYGFLTEKALRSACATDPEDIFRTECLCQWVESLAPQPFPEKAWAGGVDEHSRIAPESPIYYGIDLSQDRKWTSIAVCGMRDDGNYHIEVVARRTGTEWAIDWFRARAVKGPMKLAFQSRGAPVSGLAEQICTIRNIERIAVEGSDLPTGWGRFWDGIAASAPVLPGETPRGGVKIFHLPQPVMDIVAGTMQVRNLGGGAELPDRVKSAGDISPLFAAVMAFTAATRIDQSKVKLYESAYANGAPLVFV
jgi:phage terminase large subunit-like protein